MATWGKKIQGDSHFSSLVIQLVDDDDCIGRFWGAMLIWFAVVSAVSAGGRKDFRWVDRFLMFPDKDYCHAQMQRSCSR